ncbi:MAG: hypothetical protein AAGH68_04425 [Pseudomonadota bacterium]
MTAHAAPFPWRTYLWAVLAVSIWVNASEVARYFLLVMPAMRDSLAVVPDIAPMNLPVFLIWGLWDTVLVCLCVLTWWMWAERFGPTLSSAIWAGTMSFAFLFGLFWLAMWNMNLATPGLLAMALPWAWVEMVVASLIARRIYSSLGSTRANG